MDEREIERLQQRLNQVEASHTRLLHHLPGMAYRCKVEADYEYTLVFASQGCEKLLGMTEQTAMQNPVNTVERLTLEEDLAAMRKSIHEAISAHQSYEVYYRIRLASGEEKWIWDQGEGVFDERGDCVFLEGIMMDVTAQKTRELSLRRENRRLRSVAPESPDGLGKIIGRSSAMKKMYNLMTKAAKSDTSVILYGETGVGKDLAAKTIHDLSGLKGRYIPVNCAAIPEQLLESEFFGHTKGAFSGATTNRAGYLSAADNGTLFLDEIAELPLNLQVKLLRALESKTYTPVGSNEVKTSNFRLISATNRDLGEMVRAKAMRADFFYRIHVLTIVIPSLRERKGDIALLVKDYARRKSVEAPLPADLMASFEAHAWPGNVRELQNTLERYWAFGDAGITLRSSSTEAFSTRSQQYAGPPGQIHSALPFTRHAPEDKPGEAPLFPSAEYLASRSLQDLAPSHTAVPSSASLTEAKDETEKQRILYTLEQNGWKKGKTADALGVTMRTLQRKLKKYSLRRD